MKTIFYIFLSCLSVIFLSSCGKRNYFPDENNPGLSRFTSYGFNIGTFYINDTAYINTYYTGRLFGGITNSLPRIQKIVTNSTSDTLIMSWPIELNDGNDTAYNFQDQMISLLLPIPKSFNKADFIAMRGIRFASNTNSITLQTIRYYNHPLSGLSNIFFIKIDPIQTNNSTSYLELSGLFNGNIGDSILITKGRFDFKIDVASLNF